MALSDYRLCDVCGNKAFYDANLNWGEGWSDEVVAVRYVGDDGWTSLDYLGDWAVLCVDCAKTHRTAIVKREISEEVAGG